MAIRPILQYPDPRLHTVARPITRVDESVRELVRDMADTMYDAPGVGLAATQVDVHRRVIVIDTSETKDALQVLINPEIIERFGEQECDEGCLSVPGIYEPVVRASRVIVEATNLDGERIRIDADGLLAVCIQHEMDHLEGKVFVERLSRLKQSRIRSRMLKRLRETA